MAKQRYTSDERAHKRTGGQGIDYQGNEPRHNPGQLPVVDDECGLGHKAKEPDPVKGHSGHLQKANEARDL